MGRYSNQERLLTNLQVLLGVTSFRSPDQPARRREHIQHRLRPDEEAELVARYQGGQTVYALAHGFRIHRNTVSAILERHGVSRRFRILSEADIQLAADLYAAGASLAKLGQRFSVDDMTVLNAFRKAGIRTRPRAGSVG